MNKRFVLELLIGMILASIFTVGLGIQSIVATPATIVFPDGCATMQEATYRALDGGMIVRSATVRDYWPTTAWRYSTAEEQGMNSTKLEEMMEHIRSESLMLDSVVVVRNGYVVLEEYPRSSIYSQNTLHSLYSCTKSVMSMLIGIALEEAYIDNVQHKLVDFFPNRSIANMDSRKQAITLEQVLTMISGLQWDEWTYPYGDTRNDAYRMIELSPNPVQFVLDQPMANEPGTEWVYNSGGSHLLSAIVYETTNTSPQTFALEKLLHPLGITANAWTRDPQGLPWGCSDLHLRPLDMAKLGFLYLNRGAWDEDQIVPSEWVDESTRAHFHLLPEWDYGYQWWIHPSTGLYWAWGSYGQRIAVAPDYDLVVVFTGTGSDDRGDELINNYILPAVPAPPTVVPEDYPTIQEAINNAEVGDTIFVKSGTYYEHVVINKTVSLFGEDVGTTIIDGNNTGHVIHVVSNNVSVSGFTVQRSGNIHNPYLEAGICLNNSADCTISGNRLIDNGFCGISLLYSQRNRIVDNTINRSNWGGIHLLSSSYNMISGNTVDNTFGGINGHVSSHYNNITDNTISNSTHGTFWHASNYNNFCRNNISTITLEGIWLQDQVNFNLVAENRITNTGVAIRLQGPNNNNTVSNNFITGCEYGVKIENNARYTRIEKNVIVDNNAGSDSWRAGIRLDNGAYSEISSNVISGNHYGILLYSYSPNVSICDNSIVGNEFGLRVASGGSHYLNATLNLVAHNQGYGIGLTGFSSSSNYATIYKNTIVNNSDGIALGQYSNFNTIIQNTIAENGQGIYIEYSTQNTIRGNSIRNNQNQTYVATGSVNIWDGGYPSGGNYWSDYNGTDLFSGAYQNETGSDGIGDTPYSINSVNADNYPLAQERILKGDINGDGWVNGSDAVILGKSIGSKIEDPSWNQTADLNQDSYVNAKDAVILGSHFGEHTA